MAQVIRFDPPAMRTAATQIDQTAGPVNALSYVLPGLADSYDLPPGIGGIAHATLGAVGQALRNAAADLADLAADIEARAELAEIADQVRGHNPSIADRLTNAIGNWECPIDDPLYNNLLNGVAAGSGIPSYLNRPIQESADNLIDGLAGGHLRNSLNADPDLDFCMPPTPGDPFVPPPPPPRPEPAPDPSFLERLEGARDDVNNWVDGAVDDIGDALPAPPEPGEGPFGPLPPFPVPGPLR